MNKFRKFTKELRAIPIVGRKSKNKTRLGIQKLLGVLAFGSIVLVPTMVRSATTSWEFDRTIDDMTDVNHAVGGTRGNLGELLLVGCKKDEVIVAVQLRTFDFSIQDVADVQFRVDHQEIVSMTVPRVKNGYLFSEPSSLELIRMINSANGRFVFSNGETTVVFNLQNSKEVLAKIDSECEHFDLTKM
jgi:hypothetical protein